jgi:hypothetical protein
MIRQPRVCPFCLSPTLALLANFHDTLTAFRCETCHQMFYTVELRFAASQPIVEPLEQRSATHLRTAVASCPETVAAPRAGVRRPALSFGRRLRRP